MAKATPSSSAAAEQVAQSDARTAKPVNTTGDGMVFVFNFGLALIPSRQPWGIVSKRFIRCQHIVGRCPDFIYKS